MKLAPKRIVYVSCNPETLARDLYTLSKGGYKVRKIQPVDMFPFTSHVESVVRLERRLDNELRERMN
jgi:23S rRNA (uracil1939-C5)-methyltransferase